MYPFKMCETCHIVLQENDEVSTKYCWEFYDSEGNKYFFCSKKHGIEFLLRELHKVKTREA